MNASPTTLATKQVPNGRWGDHTVSVRVDDEGRHLYCNGWSDPLECSKADAFRYFNENVGQPYTRSAS